jgi:hypothetical protein
MGYDVLVSDINCDGGNNDILLLDVDHDDGEMGALPLVILSFLPLL